MKTRSATVQDAGISAELIRELARAEGETSPVTPEFVRDYLAHPGSHILLAEEDGQVVGLLSYSAHPDLFHAGLCGEIEALVVREEARGKGVGQTLVEQVMAIAEEQGWAEVSVSTMPDNTGALHFYRKMGFGDEAVLLERHI